MGARVIVTRVIVTWRVSAARGGADPPGGRAGSISSDSKNSRRNPLRVNEEPYIDDIMCINEEDGYVCVCVSWRDKIATLREEDHRVYVCVRVSPGHASDFHHE